MVEELLVHEAVVAALVLLGNAHVLVQVEGGRPGEIHHALTVERDQMLVGGNGRGARGEAQNAVRTMDELRGHQRCRRLAHLGG